MIKKIVKYSPIPFCLSTLSEIECSKLPLETFNILNLNKIKGEDILVSQGINDHWFLRLDKYFGTAKSGILDKQNGTEGVTTSNVEILIYSIYLPCR